MSKTVNGRVQCPPPALQALPTRRRSSLSNRLGRHSGRSTCHHSRSRRSRTRSRNMRPMPPQQPQPNRRRHQPRRRHFAILRAAGRPKQAFWQKRLQLLHDLVPNARRFGYLVNPDNRGGEIQNVGNTVRRWGGTLEVASSRPAPDFDAAFAEFAERHVEAVVIGGDALFACEPVRLSRLASQYAVPVIYASAASVRYGGLMSYCADARDAFRQAWSLCRRHPQRRETGRSAGRPAD
jgi:hypothetical protein